MNLFESYRDPDMSRSARLMSRKIAHLGPASWDRFHRSPILSDDRKRILNRAFDEWTNRRRHGYL